MVTKRATDTVAVQVVYATPGKQVLKNVSVPRHSTIEAVITLSGILMDFPEIDLLKNDVGVFSERRHLTDVIHAGDRVEIYRPLIIEPREIRRRRANAKG